MLEAHESILNCGKIILNLGKHQLPNAKGGAMLLNILVFLNSNTCFARKIHKKLLFIACISISDLISL